MKLNKDCFQETANGLIIYPLLYFKIGTIIIKKISSVICTTANFNGKLMFLLNVNGQPTCLKSVIQSPKIGVLSKGYTHYALNDNGISPELVYDLSDLY